MKEGDAMQDIYYINHINQKINLMESPYFISSGDLYNYSWVYDSTNNNGRFGGKITKFTRGITEKVLNISVKADTMEVYYDALNKLMEITETDVVNKVPGRLYADGQYLICYITQSTKTKWEIGIEFLENALKIVAEYPFWLTENNYNFLVPGGVSPDNKRYPMRYPHRYVAGSTQKTIINEHFAPSDIKLVIYGPASNPYITIANNTYAVNIQLLDKEYLVLDTANKTITKVQSDGAEVNAFNNRVKAYDVFAKIPPGASTISWSANYKLDVTIYEERSEPKWILS